MQTKKFTRNWAIASAVAAMLAASASGVYAQDTTAAPAPGAVTAPDQNATPATPANGTGSATMTGGDMSSPTTMGMMDYHILSNRHYDYVDLEQAKARGLSDNQIATIAKIARKSDTPFRTISAAVERGETFPVLATEYGLKLSDVYENDKEKQQIANYISTYEFIGTHNGSPGGSMMGTMPDTTAASSPDMSANPTTPATMTPTTPMANTATMDIVDTAMAAKNLSTLVKAIQAAGLVETLKGAGPFTVFAPDNKAFSRLPAGTLDALMADPAKLKQVLSYHVIPASVDADAAMSMTSPTSPPTVEGSTLQVTKGKRGKLMINNATVTKANIQATNGIIHVIDRVLLPPMDAAGNIVPAGTDTTAPATPAAPAAPTP